MEEITTQQKTPFREVYLKVKPNYETLKNLLELDGVPVAVLHRMLVGNAVTRTEAQKVLAAFSRLANHTYSLEVVSIILIADEEQEATYAE